jgi:hypothetical protein
VEEFSTNDEARDYKAKDFALGKTTNEPLVSVYEIKVSYEESLSD